MSVGGLFVAAHAGYGVAYYGGLLYFGFAVFFVMLLVKVGYDEVHEVSALSEFRVLLDKTINFLHPDLTHEEHGQIVVNSIGIADLKEALAKGFDDYKEMPTHVIFLIVIYPLVTLIFGRISGDYDVLPLVFPLLAGYTLIGPLAATGMYELSRRREQGLGTHRRYAFGVFVSPHIRAIAGLGVILMAIYYVWLQAATEIYDQIFAGVVPESVADFTSLIVNTPAGMTLMLVGSGAGFAFAAAVFALSVVSFPMLLDRDVSIITAVQTSIRAVLVNPVTMGIWGFIIAGALLLGALPFFIGLAFVLPMLGHASWHLYRKVVEH